MTRSVGVDLGARRIGIAVSDAVGSLAFPRPSITRHRARSLDHLAIAGVAEEVGAQVVVVGLPLSLDGSRGRAARAVEEEAADLSALLGARGIRVETFDERFTTVVADSALASAGVAARERRGRVDSAAATVLLQAWLDSR
jgi:putative Holliday junction resolvase